MANNHKMITLEHRAVGSFRWNERDEARIERNLFALEGETWEALRFCKNRDGRHNRVHLVIGEDEFVELFRDAVRQGVFSSETLRALRGALEEELGSAESARASDPVRRVIGIGADGKLTQEADAELYDKE